MKNESQLSFIIKILTFPDSQLCSEISEKKIIFFKLHTSCTGELHDSQIMNCPDLSPPYDMSIYLTSDVGVGERKVGLG